LFFGEGDEVMVHKDETLASLKEALDKMRRLGYNRIQGIGS
jgi:hypothetical protein